MNKKLRKTIIAGNWKMNKTPADTLTFINELIPSVMVCDCEVVLCVPFINIPNAVQAARNTNIKIGAQNLHFEEKGAYTGEISAEMLTCAGCEYVIIGHSERRQYFAETDLTVNKKVVTALKAGLKPIICVGEHIEERQQGITNELVAMQTKIALLGVSKDDLKNIIIAYEPIWAIGTGLTATSEQADETNGIIRKTIASLYGEQAAEGVTIQYGGSMNAKNAVDLLNKYNIDGGLIGGASLKIEDFTAIVKASI